MHIKAVDAERLNLFSLASVLFPGGVYQKCAEKPGLSSPAGGRQDDSHAGNSPLCAAQEEVTSAVYKLNGLVSPFVYSRESAHAKSVDFRSWTRRSLVSYATN